MKKIVTIIITIMIFCVLFGVVILNQMTNMNYTKLDKSDAALGIKAKNIPQAIDRAPYMRLEKNLLAVSRYYVTEKGIASHTCSKFYTIEIGTTPQAGRNLPSGEIGTIPQEGSNSPSKEIETVSPANESPSKNIETPLFTRSKVQKLRSIALFGIDRRDRKSNSRSDLIMVMTIDYTNKKVKLSSIMRDLYVHIDGHGYTKLTHAYAYGGPQLALKTLNQNFGLDIRDFCSVDFFSMKKIIDVVGGVEIDVAENEVKYLNSNAIGLGQPEGSKLNLVTKSGIQLLNGAQAVDYSRIRHIGHGDFDRTERQRKVLRQLINKIKNMGSKDAIGFLGGVFPCVETSLKKVEVIEIAFEYFKSLPIAVEETRFPMDGSWTSGNINGIYYIKADMNKMKKKFQNYIYYDIKP